MRNFSTMCKIGVKKKPTVRKKAFRGFNGHHWLKLKIKKKQQETTAKRNNSEIQHICQSCGQSFSCVRNLNRHKKLHTSYERLQCDLCLRTYSNLANFKIHIPRHHNKFGIQVTFTKTIESAKNHSKTPKQSTLQ